jgi:di/tricarboxylate transporter
VNAIAVTLIVLALAIVLFVSNRVPVGLVAIGVALALFFTGVLDFEQTIAGFGDPVIIFIAALFVVGEGLDATGVTTWAGQQLTRRAGTRRSTIVLLVSLLVAALTAVISVNGAVAALVPMVVVLAMRIGQPPSQLLMPLAFAAHAGSLLLLSGTPVNLLVSELAEDATGRTFGYAEFALVGVPLLVGTVLVLVLLGPRLLPRRSAEHAPRDLSAHAETLVRQYSLELGPGESAFSRDTGLAEVIVLPRSDFVGETVFPGMVTQSGELVIAAVQRGGEDQGRTVLAPGDVMLLQGTWDALAERTVDRNVAVVDRPDAVRRQAVPLSGRARTAIAIVAGMIVLLATGVVPTAIAALLAAAAMVLLRVLTVVQAHRSISWTTLILVAGMIPLSTAIQVSGAADLVAGGIVDLLGSASPHLLILGIGVVTVVLGQLISNLATALILGPISIAIAGETGVSPLPLLMAVAVTAAASFLTPVATPANTMVLGPGGYRFGDYWKLGLPLIAVFLLVATFLVPVFWPF